MSSAVLLAQPRLSEQPALRTVRIALAGCGVVGGELARLIHRCGPEVERQQGVKLEIVTVLVRDAGKARHVPLARSLFTTDVDHFLSARADIVVEALGGVDTARRIAHATLGRGARLVTANKALLAEHADELLGVARSHGGTLDFEAAVGGGIPVVRALRQSLRNASVRRIDAILNGTTNYILTRIEHGESFGAALRSAQLNGFAESDPTRDLNGLDTADKLRVLAWLAFGVSPVALPVHVCGIGPQVEPLVCAAAAQNACVRLIGTVERSDSGVVSASVEPRLVPRDSVFGRTVDEQNAVVADFGWNQPITLSGPGAGGLPTATALLGDILC